MFSSFLPSFLLSMNQSINSKKKKNRWGNPANFRMGSKTDQKLFCQHSVCFIRGFPFYFIIYLFFSLIFFFSLSFLQEPILLVMVTSFISTTEGSYLHVKYTKPLSFSIKRLSNSPFSLFPPLSPPTGSQTENGLQSKKLLSLKKKKILVRGGRREFFD